MICSGVPKLGILGSGTNSRGSAELASTHGHLTPFAGPKLLLQALHSIYTEDSIILRVVEQNDFDVVISERTVLTSVIKEKINISPVDELEHTVGVISIFTEDLNKKVDLMNMRATFTRMFEDIDTDKNGA